MATDYKGRDCQIGFQMAQVPQDHIGSWWWFLYWWLSSDSPFWGCIAGGCHIGHTLGPFWGKVGGLSFLRCTLVCFFCVFCPHLDLYYGLREFPEPLDSILVITCLLCHCYECFGLLDSSVYLLREIPNGCCNWRFLSVISLVVENHFPNVKFIFGLLDIYVNYTRDIPTGWIPHGWPLDSPLVVLNHCPDVKHRCLVY